MAAATVPKLYRSVIDEVINSVREGFLDDGVDEQILLDLKANWEKKLNDSKAVDTNAKEPEPVPVSKANSRTNNSAASRNAQHNRDNRDHAPNHQQQSQTPQHQQQQHVQTQQSHPQTVQLGNHHQVTLNQTLNHGGASSIAPQMAIHGNYIQSPSGVLYHTNDAVDVQKTMSAVPQKLVLVQTGHGSNMLLTSQAGGTFNISPEIFNQIALQPGGVITQTQPTVVHHTSNVNQNPVPGAIQYASSNQRQTPQSVATARPQQPNRVVQLDGADDTSDEDDDEDEYRDNDDDHDDNDDEINDEENEGQGEDEEPLNSEDDVSDEDPTELFDTDNVVVCQYDKITRSRNKWKFHLKDGIMNLQGKDFVFQKAIGDAEW